MNALAHGASDFVPKPYRPQIIQHRVASIINLRETAALANQFKYDRLTGIYSKRFFYQQVREILRQNPEEQYDILSVNIENFKLFNDVFGIKTGDRLICDIAGHFRKMEGEFELFSRFRAERFVMLNKHTREYDEEMFHALSQQLTELPNASKLNFRWGVYRIVDCSVPVERMCDRVMLAADSIKGQYMKYFAVYDDSLRNQLLQEQEMVDDMAAALEEKQFEVYFQAKYSLTDGSLSGAEALVRWIHPQRGFISPGEFIPLFEKNGFITSLDYFVWERTCCMIQQWKKMGFSTVPVSVNVSRADFYQADLAEVLLEMTQKYELLPSELHLEVTESAYTENPRQILTMVDELRKRGFVIELDDFGSGYSSLNMLNEMNLDIMKLDMKFIRSEMAKPADQGILRFIVSLAHWMNLKVVAEGVETQEQVVRLKEMGCDYAQGYFFARPLPPQEFEKIMYRTEAE